MNIKRIETLENWLMLKVALKENGYKLWQWQYDTKHPDGLHMWFWRHDREVEVITHSPEVEDDFSNSLGKI